MKASLLSAVSCMTYSLSSCPPLLFFPLRLGVVDAWNPELSEMFSCKLRVALCTALYALPAARIACRALM